MNAQRAVAVRASCTRSCCGKPSRPEDLTGYLDRDTLIAVWPELHLPEGVRQAREEHHPQLRRVTWDGLMPVGDLHRQIAALALVGAGSTGSR